ncbi:MAG: 1-acyl-sn-glycerol-3-phosphate acyltransferase [Polyangiaceae bacterium]|nr:1-acyl-sn-glycerol-3-phosphate acyltransferase [Polyangiaceae bacterium]
MIRPDLVAAGGGKLSRTERVQIRLIRASFEPGTVDRGIRFLQRTFGSTWIHHCTKHLRRVHGLERVPPLQPARSYVLVSNHRSFFDLYVVTAELVRRGLSHRIVFPVRSNFFYDRASGFVVNGVMSFFAMYPPIFRERSRAALNVASLEEVRWLLQRGGVFVGIHPEGTRKTDDDPYTFLPAQTGVGKVVHGSGAVVLPVFINGLINDLGRQVRSNFDGTGRVINVVFGEPIELSDLQAQPHSPRVYRAISERCMTAISRLGQEERQLREQQDRT